MVDDWNAGIQAIRENGVTLHLHDQQINQSIQTCLVGEIIPQCETALVLVKSWQTDWAASQLFSCLSKNGIAVTLQNGLGNDTILKNYLGDARVGVGVTTLGATLISPGRVNGFENGDISLQGISGIGHVLSLLQSAGFSTSIDPSIERIIWGKLIINAAINPLTALLGIANGKLAEIPAALDLMSRIVNEAVSVSAKLQISLPYDDPIQQIEKVIRGTALNYSSMYQDIQRSAPTEIDQINGSICRLGEINDVQTPYNRSVTLLIKSRVLINTLR